MWVSRPMSAAAPGKIPPSICPGRWPNSDLNWGGSKPTPPRINARTINFAVCEKQPGDEPPVPFSHFTEKITQSQLPCWITYTNENTHQIIRESLDRSPLYSGVIKSKGPRYC